MDNTQELEIVAFDAKADSYFDLIQVSPHLLVGREFTPHKFV